MTTVKKQTNVGKAENQKNADWRDSGTPQVKPAGSHPSDGAKSPNSSPGKPYDPFAHMNDTPNPYVAGNRHGSKPKPPKGSR